jgi:hypothetical protein
MEKKDKPQYPTNFDVVNFKGKEVQIVVRAQTKDPKTDIYTDIYVVKNTETGETFRVTGAKFVPSSTQEPIPGQIYKGDEDVRVTGSLTGGKKEN